MSRVTTYKLKGIAATLNQVTIPAGHTFRVNGILNNSKSTSAIQLPSGTTAQRPSTAIAGMFRFNTTNTKFEGYNGSAWGEIGGTSSGTGTGNITIDGGNFANGSSTVSTSSSIDGGSF